MDIKFMDYSLRLDARRTVELEKKLGKSPLSIFMGAKEGQLPSLGELLLVLHASLQPLQHGIKEDDVYAIYDKFIAEGKEFKDLIPIIIDLYRECGLLPKEDAVEDSKN